jgi:hypothetical protein
MGLMRKTAAGPLQGRRKEGDAWFSNYSTATIKIPDPRAIIW